MSVLVECYLPAEQKAGLFVFTKGAPEVLAEHLIKIPAFYHETYVHHMTRGKRVLALAYRSVFSANPAQTLQELRDAPRSKVETDLVFAGFLVFDCDLKADSKSVVKELRNSDHKVIMITGDSAYTAADVAAKLGMTRTGADSGLLILESTNKSSMSLLSDNTSVSTYIWKKSLCTAVPATGKRSSKVPVTAEKDLNIGMEIDFNPSRDAFKELASKYSLCVTGTVLTALLANHSSSLKATAADGKNKVTTTDAKTERDLLQALCPHVTIFARVSPAQKVHFLIKCFISYSHFKHFYLNPVNGNIRISS